MFVRQVRAVFLRGAVETCLKLLAEIGGGGKSHGVGDCRDGQIRVHQKTACAIESDPDQHLNRRGTVLLFETADQVCGMAVHHLGKVVQIQSVHIVGGQILHRSVCDFIYAGQVLLYGNGAKQMQKQLLLMTGIALWFAVGVRVREIVDQRCFQMLHDRDYASGSFFCEGLA